MLAPAHFLTHTLRHIPQGMSIARILAAALQAVEPGAAVHKTLHRQGNRLWAGKQEYDLSTVRAIKLLAVGKAAEAMALAAADILGERLTGGLVIPKHAAGSLPPHLQRIVGGHPTPNAGSLAAGDAACALAGGLGEQDLLLCLISGGGSALMTAPHPGITLPDMQALTTMLLACGASINEINALRRRLDRVKGGGLARLAAPARVVSLILSDVIGSPLEAIASGPTAPDPTTRTAALGVVERYSLAASLPPTISSALHEADETLKPGDPALQKVQNLVIGSNRLAAEAALAAAAAEGFAGQYLGDAWQGEARLVGQALLQKLKTAPPAPACLVAGGESTVTLRGAGLGGRNQELALSCVTALARRPRTLLITLATDGEDGPTDAAGAVVNSETISRALALGLQPSQYLHNNDSYHFFAPLDDLLKPGPTGTNVNDLAFLFTL